jgi:hypothetical protein
MMPNAETLIETNSTVSELDLEDFWLDGSLITTRVCFVTDVKYMIR